MKIVFLVLQVALFILSISQPVNASLYQLNSGSDTVVYDEVAGKYWVQDLSLFTNKTYVEQETSIEILLNDNSYFNGSDWHMATSDDMEDLWTALGGTYYIQNWFDESNVLEVANGTVQHWIGRYNEENYDYSEPAHRYAGLTRYPTSGGTYNYQYVSPGDGKVTDSYVADGFGAWVVADSSSISPVPVPGAVWLLGSGLVGIVGIRKKFKK